MPLSLYRPNPLAYPGYRLPGFNPNHFASKNISQTHGLSVVPATAANNFINIIRGQKGTISGTASNITRNIFGNIGPTIGFVAANSNAINFAGFPATTESTMTAAAIFYSSAPTATVASPFIGNSTAAATGQFFGYNSTPVMIGYVVGVGGTALGNLTVTANTPYFAVWSLNGTTLNALQLNLNTGKILTQSVADANAVPASNGTYGVGGNSGNANFGTVNIAAAMLAPGLYITAAAMQQWAADPWAFWYPHTEFETFNWMQTLTDTLMPQIVM